MTVKFWNPIDSHTKMSESMQISRFAQKAPKSTKTIRIDVNIEKANRFANLPIVNLLFDRSDVGK